MDYEYGDTGAVTCCWHDTTEYAFLCFGNDESGWMMVLFFLFKLDYPLGVCTNSNTPCTLEHIASINPATTLYLELQVMHLILQVQRPARSPIEYLVSSNKVSRGCSFTCRRPLGSKLSFLPVGIYGRRLAWVKGPRIDGRHPCLSATHTPRCCCPPYEVFNP